MQGRWRVLELSEHCIGWYGQKTKQRLQEREEEEGEEEEEEEEELPLGGGASVTEITGGQDGLVAIR